LKPHVLHIQYKATIALELTALAHIVLLQLGGPISRNYPKKHSDIFSIVSSEPRWHGYLNLYHRKSSHITPQALEFGHQENISVLSTVTRCFSEKAGGEAVGSQGKGSDRICRCGTVSSGIIFL